MKIRDIDENFSGAIASVAMPLKPKKKAKKEDAQIGGFISNTSKRYGPAKGPKFTAGAGMKNATYPQKRK